MGNRVVIIGGGIAGMQAAISAKERGLDPVIIERSGTLGGKLQQWDRLFPSLTPASEVVDELNRQVAGMGIDVRLDEGVKRVDPAGGEVYLDNGATIPGDAFIVASGFNIFDARRKEELGYGVYDNVITSVDLERMLKERRVLTAQGAEPRSIAFLHCVGSRDEQVKQPHCSRLCCITGVKQAIEVKELMPGCDVTNFYMDMRMFGAGYEGKYIESQQKWGVKYVRGRISEAGETIDGRIQIKAEDTLAGRPLRMTVDMLVLLVGMSNSDFNLTLNHDLGLELRKSRFLRPQDEFLHSTGSGIPNLFYAGTVTSPKNVAESLNEAMAVAAHVDRYLKNR